MRKILMMFALLTGFMAAYAQQSGGDYFEGLSRKIGFSRMIPPHGLEITYDKTVHVIFPSPIKYVDLGSTNLIAGKADGAENVIRVKAARKHFRNETNMSVITEDGNFYTFNVKYADEPLLLNVEMCDFIHDGETVNRPNNAMEIYLQELGSESPRLVRLIMKSVHKQDKHWIKHIGCKRFGVRFLLKGLYTHGDLLYFHTEVCMIKEDTAMKDKWRILKSVLVITLMASVILACYIKLTAGSSNTEEPEADTSEVGKILSKDMQLNYPSNPHDVVLYYSRIIKAYYDGEYNDDQLNGLAQHARATFDDELLSYNDYDEYMERLRAEIESYKLNKKKIVEYTIQRASDIEYLIDNSIQYAKVKAVYYTAEDGGSRSKVYEEYTLRQDKNSQWKIVFWDVIPETSVEGD